MHVELKHTLTVDKNVWWIKLYCWLWEADIKQITFCKLFWAYVFIVPGLVVRGMIGVIKPIAKRFEKRKRQKTPKVTMKIETSSLAKPTGPSTMQRLLGRIEHAAARVAMAIKAAWAVVGMDGKLALLLGRVLIGIGLLVGLAAAGAVVWALVEFSTARMIVITGVALVLAALLLLGFMLLLDRLGVWDLTGEGLGYGGRGIKRGAVGFWGMMVTGYVAIKSSTCPKIEVK